MENQKDAITRLLETWGKIEAKQNKKEERSTKLCN